MTSDAPDRPEGELQPDLSELEQRETADPVVPVRVAGPVRSQAMPRRAGSTRTLRLDQGQVSRLLNDDMARAHALVACPEGAVFVAWSQAEADSGTGFLLTDEMPPIPITAWEALYVAGQGVGESIVTVITEQWTV